MSDSQPFPILIPSTLALVLDNRTVDYDEITRQIADAQGRIDRIKEELGMGKKSEVGSRKSEVSEVGGA